MKILRYGEPGARPKAYLQASLHADELPGMIAAHHLMGLLDAAEAAGQVLGEIVWCRSPTRSASPRSSTACIWAATT